MTRFELIAGLLACVLIFSAIAIAMVVHYDNKRNP